MAGIELAVLLEHPRQHVHAHGHAARDGEAAAQEAVGLRDLPHDVLHVAVHAVGQAQEQLAGSGEGGALAPAVEEPASQLLLQQLHLPADGGLRDVQALGRAGEASLLGHGPEHLELAHVHGRPPRESDGRRPEAPIRSAHGF
jgi:hypothetical protein